MGIDPLDNNFAAGFKLRSEDIGYKQEEMAVCSGCGKANPPNRSSCMYCAAQLEGIRADLGPIKLNLRRLEDWEKGFNVVLNAPAGENASSEIAKLFGYSKDLLDRLLSANSFVPLGRLESAEDADLAIKYLGSVGVSATIVSDEKLSGFSTVRLRSIEFSADEVVMVSFNTGEREPIANGDIALLVAGTIRESRQESIEKAGKKSDSKVLSESSTATDERVLDIYSASGDKGWRITTKGFDFSSLGSQKGLIAGENLDRLTERLRQVVPSAKFVDEYDKLCGELGHVWPLNERKDFEGQKRTGVFRSGFSTVVRTTNLDQFSRYSILQKVLV